MLPCDGVSTTSTYYDLRCTYFEKKQQNQTYYYVLRKTLDIYQTQRTRDRKIIQRAVKTIAITKNKKKE